MRLRAKEAALYFWAGVSFCATGGQTADFLQRASGRNFKLRNICPVFGGVSAQCGAGRYRALARLAKSCHVRLHLTARQGLYFRLRKPFARRGIWCGLLAFLLFWQMNQSLIWQRDCSDLTTGQQARVQALLWEACEIAPGAYASESLLAWGETMLLTYDQEFSWVSLNFTGGRLCVEVNAATAVPEIAVGQQADIVARTAGRVVSVNLRQGTAMVAAGDDVEAGQVLIASAHLEHDQETLVYELTAGEVLAEFAVTYATEIDLLQQVSQPVTLALESNYQVFAFGRHWTLPTLPTLQGLRDALPWQDAAQTEAQANAQPDETPTDASAQTTTRVVPLSLFGFCLPVTLIEENTLYCQPTTLMYSESEALALARLACSEQLYAAYPDAEIIITHESHATQNNQLRYEITYQTIADICDSAE